MSSIRTYKKVFAAKYPEYNEEFCSLDEKKKIDSMKNEVIEGPRPCVLHTELTEREKAAFVLLVELLPKEYGTCEEILALVGEIRSPTVLTVTDRPLELIGYK